MTTAKRRVLPPWRRYRQIAAVLVRHGLGDTVSTLHLAWPKTLAPAEVEAARARRVRVALAELGPTFIKFGQALSTRGDMLSPALAAELVHLQDDAPAMAPGEAERAIEAALGQPVGALFAAFDPVPVAAASVAQVHRARLPDGTVVAVKVRRPGIERTIDDDLAVLRRLARWAERHVEDATLYSPSEVVEQFARSIHDELDLAREGRVIERFAAHAAGDPRIRIPQVYHALTSAGVLTMEFLDGVKLSAPPEAWPSGTNPPEIARRGADILLQQILADGLFHADLHPGNIVLFPGNVIGLLDFGIVGRLDDATRDDLTELVLALGSRDADGATARLLDITQPRHEINTARLRDDVGDLIDSYLDLALADVPLGEVLHRVQALVSKHRLRLPPNLALLIKALLTIEGVGLQLDPSFRMMEHAAPFALRQYQARLTPEAIAARALHAGRSVAGRLRRLPDTAADLLQQLRNGDLQVTLAHRNLEPLAREIARASIRLGSGVVLAGILVAGALLTTSATGAVAWWNGRLFVVAIIALGLFSFAALHRTRR
jgi:ubiquinone biosynthesis protein